VHITLLCSKWWCQLIIYAASAESAHDAISAGSLKAEPGLGNLVTSMCCVVPVLHRRRLVWLACMCAVVDKHAAAGRQIWWARPTSQIRLLEGRRKLLMLLLDRKLVMPFARHRHWWQMGKLHVRIYICNDVHISVIGIVSSASGWWISDRWVMKGGFEFFQDAGFGATTEEGHEAVGALDWFHAYWLPARSHRAIAGGACEAGSNIWEGGARWQHVDHNNGEIITDLTPLSTNCCSLYVLTCITLNIAQWLSLKITLDNVKWQECINRPGHCIIQQPI